MKQRFFLGNQRMKRKIAKVFAVSAVWSTILFAGRAEARGAFADDILKWLIRPGNPSRIWKATRSFFNGSDDPRWLRGAWLLQRYGRPICNKAPFLHSKPFFVSSSDAIARGECPWQALANSLLIASPIVLSGTALLLKGRKKEQPNRPIKN